MMKIHLLFALMCVGIGLSAQAQPRLQAPSRQSAPAILSVSHAASGVGIVSPGCAVVITGGQFAVESNQAQHWPLPMTLSGVTVEIGGIEAALYYAGPTEIRAIVPDVPRKIGLPARDLFDESGIGSARRPSVPELFLAAGALEGLSAIQKPLVRWYAVEVSSPFGHFSGWAAIAPTSPGFYQQTDWFSGQTVAQGIYLAEGAPPRLITAEPIANLNTYLIVNGSGFLRAKSVWVFISDEADGYWAVPATAGPMGLFTWIEQVSFAIPPDAHGQLTIVAQADAMTSNPLTVLVR